MLVSICHSLSAFFLASYAFLFSRSKYDVLLLGIIYTVALLWSLYKGECPLSYYLKKYKDPNYVLGSNVYSDDIYIVFGPNYVPAMKLFYTIVNPILQTATLYLLLKRQHFSTIVTIVYPLLFYGYYYTTRFLKTHWFSPLFTLVFAYILYDIFHTKLNWLITLF
jgi:hypothetical protein